MRELKAGNNNHTINEKDYHRLLDRFDLGRTEDDKDDSNYYIINEPCLCRWYGCSDCPIEHCSIIMLANNIAPEYCDLSEDSVSWCKDNDMEARREIQAIRDYLLSLPRL